MKRALVIVAHPDDETIWMGGTILRNRNWNWTILSLCRKNDEDRMPKFKKVCEKYGAQGIICDLDDEVLRPLTKEEVRKKIISALDSFEYDYIFTHGRNGEYGHIRHLEINKTVKDMISKGELKASKVFYFAYVPGEMSAPHDSELKIPVPNEMVGDLTELSDEEHERKVSLITDVYGFKKDIFETLSCNKMEAFETE